MALRPPSAGFSVARRMSERARAQQTAATPPDPEAALSGLAGLGGIVDALRGLVDKLATAEPSAEDPTQDPPGTTGSRSVSLGGKSARMVFGYTLRMGEDGVSAERFGDMPEAAQANRPQPPRQPIAEVFEDEDDIVVVAELPGADPAGITCQVAQGALLIEASGARRYRKSLALPAPVTRDTPRISFQNGILEVRLRREPRS